MPLFRISKSFALLLLFVALGIILRFYNLNWGAPDYYHPDERNIASAISQLHYPNQMNPHFFAYGSLPIYTIYFVGVIYNFTSCHLFTLLQLGQAVPVGTCSTVSFENAIIISRMFSATLSVLLILLLYRTGKEIKDTSTGLLAAFFAATSIGFTQYAHFGTYEMWLTFFVALFFYQCVKYWHTRTKESFLLMCISAAILVSCKVSMLVMLPIPFLLIFLHGGVDLYLHHNKRMFVLSVISSLLLATCIIIVTFFITNPYVFHLRPLTVGQLLSFLQNPPTFTTLINPDFINSMNYESGVALGSMQVFYTGEFKTAVPILFQWLRVYPFLLNPFLASLSIVSFLFLLIQIYHKKSFNLFLLLTFFLLVFMSQAFLYVKWSRYYVPTLPFLYIMVALFLSELFIMLKQINKQITPTWMGHLISALFVLRTIFFALCVLFVMSFLIATYVEPDTRVAAALWAKQHIPSQAPILSEIYDMGIVAFNPYFLNIKLFNFYDLDNNSPDVTPATLQMALDKNDYIILPSQRIMKIRLLDPKDFPVGHEFYYQLFHNQLPFRQIYQTPCDVFCTIAYAGNPPYNYEETANVFDRPVVYIFKKTK